jgi:putative nucleotidyltransferase with HDIG domain
MGFTSIFSFRPRKARPVGDRLEKAASDGRSERRRNLAMKIGIFLALLVLSMLAFPRSDLYRYSVSVGDAWTRETVIAPFDFSIFKDPEKLAAERAQVKFETPVVFREVANARSLVDANRDTVRSQLDRIFAAFEGFRTNQLRGRMAEATDDSTRYFDLRRTARLRITPDQWQALVDDFASRVPGLTSATRRPPSGTRLDEDVLRAAWEVNRQMLTLVGILDVPLDSVFSDEIIIRDERGRTEREVNRSSVYGVNEAHVEARREFERRFQGDTKKIVLATAFFRTIFQPSLEYLRGVSLTRLQEEQDKIALNEGLVETGTVIVRRGDIVTANTQRILRSFERGAAVRSGDQLRWQLALGQLMLLFAAYLFFFLYLYLLRRPLFEDNTMVLLIAILFAAILGLFALALRVPFASLYAVPVAIVSILLTVMFDSRVALFGTFTVALVGGILLHFDFEFFFATMFAGSLGVHSVRDIKNRGQFFLSAGVVFLGYMSVLVGALLFQGKTLDHFATDTIEVAINSFLLVLAYPLLWVFERSFSITTDLTYLELSDTNRPLLKEFSVKAPGSFNHALQVANLAEAAADAIGANALMTRVGALYHDIGKMFKPEYFVENQRPGENPHDNLKPRMSALIIASHVKEGVEIGREHNLPREVLDFIPMHHGTALIEFFFRRAVEEGRASGAAIREAEFRYPGPRPVSKETGILMLADSVEAASRTLDNPSHKRLESDDTNLTFAEFKTIKATFLSMLLGMYHIRVKYPEQRGAEGEIAADNQLAGERAHDPDGVATQEQSAEDDVARIQ